MEKKLPGLSRIALGFSGLIAVSVIIGWMVHSDLLRVWVPGQVKMKLNSALAVLFAVCSFFFSRAVSRHRVYHILSVFFASLVILGGLLTLAEYATGNNLGIDEFLARDDEPARQDFYAGRMSVLAAANFIFLGTVLLMAGKKKNASYQFITLTVIVFESIAILILLNFIKEIPYYIRMAIPLAVAFILLSIAIWYAQPELHKKIGFEWKIYAGFSAAVALIIALTIFSSYYNNTRVSNSRWIKHTSEVLQEAGQALFTANRLILNKEQSNTALLVDQLRVHAASMKKLTADNPIQQKRIDVIEKILALPADSIASTENLGSLSRVLKNFQQYETFLLILRQGVNEKDIESFNHTFFIFLTSTLILLVSLAFLMHTNHNNLRKSEERFKAILEAAPDACVIVNDMGVIQMVNKQTEIQFGFTREELIGQPVELLIPQGMKHKHSHHRQSYMKEPHVRGMGVGMELFAQRKDSLLFPVEISLSPLQTADATWVMASVRNISDRKKTQEQVNYQARLIEDISEAVFSCDAAFRVKSWNKAAEALFRLPAAKAIGQPLEQITKPQLTDEERLHIRKELSETGYWKGEVSYFRFDGSLLHVLISNAVTKNAHGEIDGYVSVCRDYSEQKKLENDLRNAYNEMETFSYSVSHDLRAPLRAITGFTNILEAEYTTQLDSEAQRLMHVIKSNSEKMGTLIDDLLAFSKLSRQNIVKTTVHTAGMVETIKDTLVSQTGATNISWTIGALPDVPGDESSLPQVWINLLSNAIKYSRPKISPAITISAYRDEQKSHIVFCVRDNGVGFDARYVNKLFKVFQRLHSIEEFEGTGVGLAIVEKVVSKHGGEVWAESEKDHGSAFYFSLPEG